MRTVQSSWEDFCLNLMDGVYDPSVVRIIRQAFVVGVVSGVNMGVEVCADEMAERKDIKAALDRIYADAMVLVKQ